MPFQITLWTPVDNQKIYHTQKSIYTLHLIHTSIAFNTQLTVHMGSFDIMDFITGQQRKYYYIRKLCGPLQ